MGRDRAGEVLTFLRNKEDASPWIGEQLSAQTPRLANVPPNPSARTCASRLALGEVIVSQTALSSLRFSGEVSETYLSRHRRGDWGEVTPESWIENDEAVRTARPVWSCYVTEMGHTLWIISEGDRRHTRVITPHEF